MSTKCREIITALVLIFLILSIFFNAGIFNSLGLNLNEK